MPPDLALLLLTGASIGVIHTLLGPDHYLPFVALSKARAWTQGRTAAITAACGVGHVLSRHRGGGNEGSVGRGHGGAGVARRPVRVAVDPPAVGVAERAGCRAGGEVKDRALVVVPEKGKRIGRRKFLVRL